MNTVINKEELIRTLKENCDKHQIVFEKAFKAFLKEVEKNLIERLDIVREGKHVELYIHLSEPSNHTKDYSRILTMLYMDVREEIELDETQFSQYVLDDWNWKEEWLSTTSNYLAGGS